jgi:hypothetical protein
MYAVEMTPDYTTHTKIHDDRFRNSSNIRGITSTVRQVIVLVLLIRAIFNIRH